MYNIVLAIDANFILQCSLVIESIFKFCKDEKITIHIIVDSKNNYKYSTLEKLVIKMGGTVALYECDINFLPVDINLSGHISISTYYRLLIPAILPNNLNKILYLDCDLLVLDNLKDLLDLDITEFDLACVEEDLGANHNLKIGLKSYEAHFNAGVLLINLERWRQRNYLAEFINYLQANRMRLVYWDQDVLNVVLKDKLFLKSKWNITTSYLDKNHFNKIKDMSILHFTGDLKPWNNIGNPFSEIYFSAVFSNLNQYKLKIIWFYLMKSRCFKEYRFHKKIYIFLKLIFLSFFDSKCGSLCFVNQNYS